MEVAEREVRWAEQGGKVPRVLGFVSCTVSLRCRPLKPWFFLQVPKNDGNTLWSHSATKIAISTPGSRPGAGGQEIPSEGQQGEAS